MVDSRTRRGPAPAGGPPRRRRRGLRVLAGTLSVVVLAASLLGWAASQRYLGKIQQISVFAGLSDRPDAGEGEAYNVLLVATDDRTGLSRKERNKLNVGHADYGRHTDTMILMHVSSDSGRVTMVSLPRDSLVTIPARTDADGTQHDAQQAKLNAAFAYGGPALTVSTVEQATGVRIDHYMEVDFKGFLRMVDALGGVEVCLPAAAQDEKSGLDLPAGRQTVQGPQALAYVRARYIDATADIGRIQRQQKFLASMMQKATSAGMLLNPVAFDSFVSAAAESVKTDEGLGSDQLMELAQRLRGLDPKNVTFMTVPVAEYDHRVDGLGSTLLWDDLAATALFAKIRDDQPVVKAKAATVEVPPGEIRVQVYNGAGVDGLGGRAATDLAKIGFEMAGPAENADASDATTTVVRYDPGWDRSVKTVAAALPDAELVAVEGLGRTIEVIVGSSYAGTSPVKVSAPTSSLDQVRSADQDICG
ncbi:MAG: LCP family protein [Candidatus Nanopelagicales bacterium]